MYTDADREIFSYRKFVNGESTEIKADPATLHRKMIRAIASDKLEDLLKQMELEYPQNPQENDIRATDELVFKATERVLAISCATFGMKMLDDAGSGDLEKDIVAVLASFLTFLAESKKKDVSSPTCSEPTGVPSSETSVSVMPIGTRSGSTATASPVNEPPK